CCNAFAQSCAEMKKSQEEGSRDSGVDEYTARGCSGSLSLELLRKIQREKPRVDIHQPEANSNARQR
ncbi:hypothetical protein, partial [Serratia marcescens]|uniref:hypothetical protein n=1 Tax=Serratia marcescens TaxID=615 RepID=UPI001C3E3181